VFVLRHDSPNVKPRAHSEAIPFQRGRKVEAPAPSPLTWISNAAWTTLHEEGTAVHRLASGRGVWLERFGPDLLLSCQQAAHLPTYLAEIGKHCAAFAFSPRRVFGKHLPNAAAERGAPTLLAGDPAVTLVTEVAEAGVRFGLDFGAGYSCGLFLDQRMNRAAVRRLRPRRLLNTFAYTCSFSVAAALAGAETLSIDLSRRSLGRGEENFRRNQLDPRLGHKFIADDVLEVLPRLARRGEKFDAIILDPPTFSRDQSGRPFKVQRDFAHLIELALALAAPSAQILLSVNDANMKTADLERAARESLRMHRRSGQLVRGASLIDFPEGHGARTVWLNLAG
jgi:23S rRNA (cytosine1962-C5)-methyltransferase